MHRTRLALALAAIAAAALGVVLVLVLGRGLLSPRAVSTPTTARATGSRAQSPELDGEEPQASRDRSGRASSIAKNRSEIASASGSAPAVRPANSVSGRVVWPDGSPAAGCAIDFEIQKKGREGHGWFFVQTTSGDGITQADGTFELRALGRDLIALTARTTSPPGFAHMRDVEPGSTGIVLVLQSGRNVAGRAADEQGAPLDSFLVTATAIEEPRDVVAARGEKGAFLLGGLHDGTWEVRAESAGHSRASPQRLVLPGDAAPLDLLLPRCARISGRVQLPSGQPAANARIRSFRPYALGLDSPGGDASSGTRADPDGQFLLEDLDAGPQRVVASKNDFADNAPVAFELRPADDVRDVVLVLQRGGRLVGEVLDPAGYPLPGLPVVASSREAHVQRMVMSDEDGKFALDALPAGKYRVIAKPAPGELEDIERGAGIAEDAQTARDSARESSGGGEGSIDARRDSAGRDSAAKPSSDAKRWAAAELTLATKLSLERSATTEIFEGGVSHVTLGGPGLTEIRVHGTVAFGSRERRPFASCLVSFGRDDLDEGPQRFAVADDAGHYELFVDAEGRYALTVSDPGSTTPFGDGMRFMDRVEIGGDPDFEHDIVLPSASVSGRVLLPDGSPAEGVRVELGPEQHVAELSSSLSVGSRDTDVYGAFAFDGLQAGVYRLTAGSVRGRVAAGMAVVKNLVLEEDRGVDRLEIRLQAPARIEGTIAGPDGKPCAGAVVFVRDDTESRLAETYPPPTSDAGGRFAIEGLPPGAFRIGARTDGLVTLESQRIELRPGETSRVALELRAGTRLRVVVQEQDGRAVGASLRVTDDRGEVVGSAYPLTDGDRAEPPAPENGARIGPIPPGHYTITATNHGGASASREISVSGDEQLVTLKYGS
jgi:hypothetical protein